MHLRFYLKTPDGLRRLPLSAIDNDVPLPQFANMTLPFIWTTYGDGETQKFGGGLLRCDAVGDWTSNYRDDVALAMDLRVADNKFFRSTENIVDLTLVRKRKNLKQKYSLSRAELDAIACDTVELQRTPIPILKIKSKEE